MKKDSINLRVSKEKKLEIERDAKSMSVLLGLKVSVSAFMLWLHENWKKSNKTTH